MPHQTIANVNNAIGKPTSATAHIASITKSTRFSSLNQIKSKGLLV